MRVLISGATGFIGSALDTSLVRDGHTVIRLTRHASDPRDRTWDPETGELDASVLDGIDAVVHLAGESIGAKRWSDEHKRRVWDSRVVSTRLLRTAIESRSERPAAFVCASAVGYYGDRGDETLTETSPPGTGFLSDLCVAWETEAKTGSTRCVQVRTGLVLSKGGGALQRMLLPARLGLGGPLGNGRQWWSWISLEDLVGIYKHALTTAIEGAVNGTAPDPVRQREFAKELGRAMRRPAFLPLPKRAITLALGEMGDHLLFDSARVLPERLGNYEFAHSTLAPALRAALA